jgi:uncharacterized protein YjbI with pentapeptide repeats
MILAPRAILRSLAAATLVALAINVISNSQVNGAPIGSPVSVTRNITMGGSNISNLLYDGTYIWVVEWSSNKVERINPSTGAIVGSPISVGTNPGAAVIVNGHLFVGNGSNTVTDIDMSNASVTRTITLTGSNISRLVYDGTYVWAISWSSSRAERFNPSTGALVGSPLTVATNPSMGTIANGHLFVTGTSGNTITDIDISTGTVTRTITLSGSNLASSMFDGTNLWVTLFNDAKVARINPTTGSVLGYTNVGTRPTNVILANGSVWVGATGSDVVTQIDLAGSVLRTISLGGNNISNLVYDGAVIWAPNYNGAFISQINATTGSVSATAPSVGSNPGAIAIVNNSIFVGSSGSTVTQISGPTPTTTTSTTTTVAPTTSTTTPTATTTTTTNVAAVIYIQAPATTVAQAFSGQSMVPTVSGTTPSQQSTSVTTSESKSIASSTSSSTMPKVASGATNQPPKISSVAAGDAQVKVGDSTQTATVTRVDNQLVVTAGALKAMLGSVDQSGATRSLDPDGNVRLKAGDKIRIRLAGFAPKSTVEAWLFSSPVLMGTEKVGADGTVDGVFTIPVDAPRGSHRIAVVTKSTDGKPTTLTVGVMVGEWEKGVNVTLWLIVLPIVLAVAGALVLPATRRRRRAV